VDALKLVLEGDNIEESDAEPEYDEDDDTEDELALDSKIDPEELIELETDAEELMEPETDAEALTEEFEDAVNKIEEIADVTDDRLAELLVKLADVLVIELVTDAELVELHACVTPVQSPYNG
jgi:hypothetical protein